MTGIFPTLAFQQRSPDADTGIIGKGHDAVVFPIQIISHLFHINPTFYPFRTISQIPCQVFLIFLQEDFLKPPVVPSMEKEAICLLIIPASPSPEVREFDYVGGSAVHKGEPNIGDVDPLSESLGGHHYVGFLPNE